MATMDAMQKALSTKSVGLPPRKRWGELVPKGGSNCGNCEYYRGSMKCGNPNFIAWAGPSKPAKSNKIPAKAPDEYCSIWWDEK